ncbi:ATP-binding protein [Candidatus Peregrinibacteria bacterium]|nr:ATP-binding protein [Candidatus Peregrinibacteria bacterium]
MKQLLETLLKEWWHRPLPTTIPRKQNLEKYLKLGVRKAICVTGFRRVGKTFLLLHLAKQIGQTECVYINFEDERLPKTTEMLTKLLEVLTELKGNKPFILLLDEIQNIPEWNVWVRRILETTNHHIFLSGSSSKLSSRELPTELRGRSVTVKIHPLNFQEFLRFKQMEPKNLPKDELLNLTREYVIYGGFPEVVLVEEGKKIILIDEYLQTFILRDILERYHIRGEKVLSQLIKIVANSSHYTISRLAKSFKGNDSAVSKATIARYMHYLENSFFIQSLELHTPSIKNRLKAERKPYLIDSLLLSRLSTEFSQNLGRLLEQVVANTLLAKRDENPKMNLFYWKDNLNHEVDFVIREQEDIKELIQTTWITEGGLLPEREQRSLEKTKKIFHCDNTKIITWDFENKQCIPLYKWLLT